MNLYLGRYVFGFAAIVFGIIGFIWHDFNTWQQINALGNVPRREIFLYIFASAELIGGIAVLWTKTMRYGAIILGTVYLIFALLWVPNIAATPRSYDAWGNFFEQFSLVSGALILYSLTDKATSKKMTNKARIGYLCFGVCVISFALEQVFYLSGTASFVPKWIPLGQMFWAITTTIAFALAAISLLSGRLALLASRLLTAMIICFGLFIWLPTLFDDPHKLFNWAGNAENLGTAGSAWIVADLLSRSKKSATK
jgi:hypothetical protein